MNLLRFLQRLLVARPNGKPDSTDTPGAPAPRADLVVSDADRLAVSKALETLFTADHRRSLGIWDNPETKAAWAHDLAVFLACGDLADITLQLLGAGNVVLAQHKVGFTHTDAGPALATNAGPALPLLRPESVKGRRVFVHHRNGRAAQHRHLLKLQWNAVQPLPLAPGDEFVTGGHAPGSVGQPTGVVFVAAEHRRELVITRALGNRGYAFCNCPELGLENVWLHRRDFQGDSRALRLGQRLTALLVALPNGVQARAARLA